MCLLSLLCCSQFTIWNTTLPEPLAIFGVSTYNDELTVINGRMSLSYSNYRYNHLSYSISLTSTGTDWSNNSVSMFGSDYIYYWGDDSVEVNDKVYVINPGISGATVTYGQSMLIYDLTLKQYVDTSTYASSPPLKTFWPCAVYNYKNNLIYVMGGYFASRTGGIHTQTYDITNDLWGSVSNINVARNDAGCDMDVSAEHIYLFGGETSAERYGSSGIEEYTISTDTWTVLSTTLIDPSREFDCTLLPSDGKIYCVGGRYYGTYMDSVQQFDPTDYSINKLTMNIPRREGKAITWGNECLLIVGGMTGSWENTDTIEYYGNCKFSSFKLEDITLTEAMSQHGIAVYDNVLYAINGYGSVSGYINGVYSMSLVSTPKVWNYDSLAMPQGTNYLGYRYDDSAQIGDKIYVINPNTGNRSSTYGQEMFIFDLILNEYVDVTSYAVTPPYRSHYPCTVAGNQMIYAIGGYYFNRKAYTQTYDIINDIWSTVANINVPRNKAGCGITIGKDFIYLFGGETDSEQYGSSGIEEYSVLSDTWTVLTETLNEPTRELDCAMFQNDGKIYCVGGRYYATYYQHVQVFDPSDYSIVTIYMNYARQDAKIAFYGTDCMIITGGNTDNGSTNTIESYGNCNFTPYPTISPTAYPTISPTSNPTISPTAYPIANPSTTPSDIPTKNPTNYPSTNPLHIPSKSPTHLPSSYPSTNPSKMPTKNPTNYPSTNPSDIPSKSPTHLPSFSPSTNPSKIPTKNPTNYPSTNPSDIPSKSPTHLPSFSPSDIPTNNPTNYPSINPSDIPTNNPSAAPTPAPTVNPTPVPTTNPSTMNPTTNPTMNPTRMPTVNPSNNPTQAPTFCFDAKYQNKMFASRNDCLWFDEFLISINCKYILKMNKNGNLILYKKERILDLNIWMTNTTIYNHSGVSVPKFVIHNHFMKIVEYNYKNVIAFETIKLWSIDGLNGKNVTLTLSNDGCLILRDEHTIANNENDIWKQCGITIPLPTNMIIASYNNTLDDMFDKDTDEQSNMADINHRRLIDEWWWLWILITFTILIGFFCLKKHYNKHKQTWISSQTTKTEMSMEYEYDVNDEDATNQINKWIKETEMGNVEGNVEVMSNKVVKTNDYIGEAQIMFCDSELQLSL